MLVLNLRGSPQGCLGNLRCLTTVEEVTWVAVGLAFPKPPANGPHELLAGHHDPRVFGEVHR